ncbi:MAG: hypothetical protein ACI86M_002990 [Saprospiraceae bacterium]|jgi:hypothetical protein
MIKCKFDVDKDITPPKENSKSSVPKKKTKSGKEGMIQNADSLINNKADEKEKIPTEVKTQVEKENPISAKNKKHLKGKLPNVLQK